MDEKINELFNKTFLIDFVKVLLKESKKLSKTDDSLLYELVWTYKKMGKYNNDDVCNQLLLDLDNTINTVIATINSSNDNNNSRNIINKKINRFKYGGKDKFALKKTLNSSAKFEIYFMSLRCLTPALLTLPFYLLTKTPEALSVIIINVLFCSLLFLLSMALIERANKNPDICHLLLEHDVDMIYKNTNIKNRKIRNKELLEYLLEQNPNDKELLNLRKSVLKLEGTKKPEKIRKLFELLVDVELYAEKVMK